MYNRLFTLLTLTLVVLKLLLIFTKPMLCIYGRHDVHSHCIGSHFLISDLKISMSFKFLSSRGTIFHTLDAKYRREFNPK